MHARQRWRRAGAYGETAIGAVVVLLCRRCGLPIHARSMRIRPAIGRCEQPESRKLQALGQTRRAQCRRYDRLKGDQQHEKRH